VHFSLRTAIFVKKKWACGIFWQIRVFCGTGLENMPCYYKSDREVLMMTPET
jgi:hypothetical protein